MDERPTEKAFEECVRQQVTMSLITRPYVDDDEVKAYRMSHIIPKKVVEGKGIDQEGISHVGNVYYLPDRLKANKNRILTERLDIRTLCDVYHYPEKEKTVIHRSTRCQSWL